MTKIDIKKIELYLEKIAEKCIELRNSDYDDSKGKIVRDLRLKLSMLIRRIYPNYEKVEEKLLSSSWVLYITDDSSLETKNSYYQKDINIILSTISTIKDEIEIFGLEDFEPVKEKIETETKIGIPRVFEHKRKKSK